MQSEWDLLVAALHAVGEGVDGQRLHNRDHALDWSDHQMLRVWHSEGASGRGCYTNECTSGRKQSPWLNMMANARKMHITKHCRARDRQGRSYRSAASDALTRTSTCRFEDVGSCIELALIAHIEHYLFRSRCVRVWHYLLRCCPSYLCDARAGVVNPTDGSGCGAFPSRDGSRASRPRTSATRALRALGDRRRSTRTVRTGRPPRADTAPATHAGENKLIAASAHQQAALTWISLSCMRAIAGHVKRQPRAQTAI